MRWSGIRWMQEAVPPIRSLPCILQERAKVGDVTFVFPSVSGTTFVPSY